MKYIVYIITAMLGLQSFCSNAMTTKTPEDVAQEKKFFHLKQGDAIIASIPLAFARELSPVFNNIIENPINPLFKAPYEYNIAGIGYSEGFADLLKNVFAVAILQKATKTSKQQQHLFLGSQTSIGLGRAKKPLVSALMPTAPTLSIAELLLKSPEQFYEMVNFTQSLQITYFDDALFQILPRVAALYPELLDAPLFKKPEFCARVAANIIPHDRYAMVGVKDPVPVFAQKGIYSTISPRGDYFMVPNPLDLNVMELYKTYPKQYVGPVGQRSLFSKDGLWLVATNNINTGAELNLFKLATGEKSFIQFFPNPLVNNFVIDASARIAVLVIGNDLVVCDLRTKNTTTIQQAMPADSVLYDMLVDDAGNTALIHVSAKSIWLNVKSGLPILEIDGDVRSMRGFELSRDGSKLALSRISNNPSNETAIVYNNTGQQVGSIAGGDIITKELSFDGRYLILYAKDIGSDSDEGKIIVYDTNSATIVHQGPCYVGDSQDILSVFQDPAKQYLVYHNLKDHVTYICDLRGSFKIIEQIPVATQQDSGIIKRSFFGPTLNTILFAGHKFSKKSLSLVSLDRLYLYDRTTKEIKSLFADLNKILALYDSNNNKFQLIKYGKSWLDETMYALLCYDLRYFNPQQVIVIASLVELSNTVSQKEKPQKTTVQAISSFLMSEDEEDIQPEEKPLIDANSWLYKIFKTLSATEQQRLLDGYPALKELMPKK